MSKPLIGILSHSHNGNQPGIGCNAAYVNYFRQKGNVILIDPINEEPLDVDLLVLPGGRDVNPVRYGEAPHINTQNPDVYYEWFYTQIFPKYVEKAKNYELAIFGICAGFQNINVHFGGKLNQDIRQEYSGQIRGKLVDKLKFIPKNQFFDIPEKWITGKKSSVFSKEKEIKDLWYQVNSIHHQGVYDENISNYYPHTLSPELIPLAYNKIFGNIEIVAHKSMPIMAVQYHPEELANPKFTNLAINYLLQTVNEKVYTAN